MLKILVLLISVTFIISCGNNEITNVEPSSDNLMKIIEDIGFSKSNIKEYKTYFTADDCYIFFKDDLISGKYSLRKTDQWVVPGIVSWSKVDDIDVIISSNMPSSGDDNWRTEISSACDEWTNISNCVVNLNESSVQELPYKNLSIKKTTILPTREYITIYSDVVLNPPLENNTIAMATWPTNGSPGPSIYVNLDFSNNSLVSSATKKYNIVHELGHCIGFRHTNWAYLGEIQATPIIGTASTDANSVMNGGTANFTWSSFSSQDIASVRALYPYSLDATFSFYRIWDYSLQDYVNRIDVNRISSAPFREAILLQKYVNGVWSDISNQVVGQIDMDTFEDRNAELDGILIRAKVRNHAGDFITYTSSVVVDY